MSSVASMSTEPLSILVAGASGFIGTPLVHALREAGHHVTTLTRSEPRTASAFRWSPGARPLDPAVLDGADVVINLAGANIGKLP